MSTLAVKSSSVRRGFASGPKNACHRYTDAGISLARQQKLSKQTKQPYDYSGYGNEVLYRMCREQPGHNDADVVANKIWLIGRTYAASIERRAVNKKEKNEDFFHERVAPAVMHSEIDKWIHEVEAIDRLTHENYLQSLQCHKLVVDLFQQITGLPHRSFASKYLHFHMPQAFFIYDSRASAEVVKRTRYQKFQVPSGYDAEYAKFVTRCFVVRDQIEQEFGHPASPRFVDMQLLKYWPAKSK